MGYTRETPEPPGGQIVRGTNGEPTGLLLAKPNAAILYATLAKTDPALLEYYREKLSECRGPQYADAVKEITQILAALQKAPG